MRWPLGEAALLAGGLAWVGCVPGPGSAGSLPLGDWTVFTTSAQPALATGCANPSCHGNAGRPLEIYAPQLHRLDPDRLHIDEPLTETELRANQHRAAAFLLVTGDGALVPLLAKPLAPEFGGSEHGGRVVYEDRLDPAYLALSRWVDSALDEPSGGDNE